MPYLPFTEIFARLDESDPTLVDRLVTAHPGLAALLPHSAGAGPTARSAILEAVHGALESLARDRPTLVVVEDVHWADESSRDLLTLLFARGLRGPLALLVTYRSDDVHRRHPLTGSLTRWTRIPGLTRLDLGPLDPGDIRTLVNRLDIGLGAEQVETIAERSEGNAFFAEELAQAADVGTTRDTTDLSRLLLSRIDELSEEARDIIRVAAVVGRRVPHDLLAHLAGCSEVELHRLLREAVDHHVLEASDSTDYVFRHALLAEAVQDDLLPGERLALHRQCVSALLEHPELGSAADLARHAIASGDLPTALAASLAAGAQADLMGGPAEALGHYEAALGMTTDGEQLHEIVLHAAAAAVGSGRAKRAMALLRAGLRHEDLTPDHRAELLTRLAFAARPTEEHVDRVALTDEALSLLDDTSPPVLRADALTRRAEALLDRGDSDAALAVTEPAMVLAERHGLVQHRADLATILAPLSEEAGDLESTLARLRAVVDEWTGPPDLSLLRATHILASVHYRQGDFPAALDAYLDSFERAREAGLEHSLYGVDSRSQAVITAWEMGRGTARWRSPITPGSTCRSWSPPHSMPPPPTSTRPGETVVRSSGTRGFVSRGDTTACMPCSRVRRPSRRTDWPATSPPCSPPAPRSSSSSGICGARASWASRSASPPSRSATSPQSCRRGAHASGWTCSRTPNASPPWHPASGGRARRVDRRRWRAAAGSPDSTRSCCGRGCSRDRRSTALT